MSPQRSLVGHKSVVFGLAAFLLNLIVAELSTGNLAVFARRLLPIYLPSMTLVQRELVISFVFPATAALCVSIFWSTKTAKWVWIVPVSLLLMRMALFPPLHVQSSVMESVNHGFWRHFFYPDFSKGYRNPRDLIDFLIFGLGTVRAGSYSLVAWISERWAPRPTENTVVIPVSDRPELKTPMVSSPRWLTATNLLIGINVAVFAIMVASGVSLLSPRTDQLVEWGANLGSITLHGQGWRLVTHSFIHLGIFHLAQNMVCLWWIGRLAEKLFGSFVLIVIYCLTAIGAGLFSALWAPLETNAGASGSILGIAGALIAVVASGQLKLPANEFFYRRISVFVFVFLLSGLAPGVNNKAHVAGFATGLFFGLWFARALRMPSPHAVFSAARLFQAREAIEKHAYESAVEYLQAYIHIRPDSANGHALLAYSFDVLQRFDEAAEEYQIAMNLGCTDRAIETNFAAIMASKSNTANAQSS